MFDLFHLHPFITTTFYVHLKQLCAVVINYLSIKHYKEYTMSFYDNVMQLMLYTAAWLAQLVGRQSAVREV